MANSVLYLSARAIWQSSSRSPTSVMYSVNWHASDGHGTESRTTVHRAGCVWPERYGDLPNWRHFETLEAAVAYAQTSPYRLNYCPCVTRARRLAEEITALKARIAAMET